MRRLKFFAALLALALLLSAPALAAAGSLRIELTDGADAPVEGVAAALWRVDVAAFSGAGVSAESLARERDAAENARTLAAYAAAESIPADAEGATDARGVLRFGELAEGTYLVVCRAGQELTFPSFLVSIPLRVGGGTRYDVTSRPKAEPVPTPTPTPEPTPVPTPSPTDVPPEPSPEPTMSPIDEGKLPQTGQDPLPVVLLAAGALALLALGVWERRKRRRAWHLFALALALALGAGAVLWTYRGADRLAGETSEALLAELELRWSAPQLSVTVPEPEPAAPAERELSAHADGTVELGEYSLLGVLRIPALGVALPVMSDWSYPLLTAAPCRYSGSLAEGDLVILGHSYRSHFRCLWTIEPGTEVELTDAAGVTHSFTVAAAETVPGTNAAALPSDYPLTLFTCTADSAHRVLVRCEATE